MAGKLKEQPIVLPCVFAGSRLSTTPQRLWPGAQWTVAVQGPRDSVWCTVYGRPQSPPSAPWSHEGHIPSIPEGTRGAKERQGVYGHELDENAYQGQKPRRNRGRQQKPCPRTSGRRAPVERRSGIRYHQRESPNTTAYHRPIREEKRMVKKSREKVSQAPALRELYLTDTGEQGTKALRREGR